MFFSQEIYLKMGKTPVIIHVLRALIALLVILMILVGTAIFLVQRESKKNILAADDTEINLVLLDSIFRKWGATIDKARNGKEALQLFKTKHYHLVLSDVYMPEMDGMELTRQIRNSVRPANKDVPVIILSANTIQDEIEKFKLAGVTEYPPKPFLAADLYKIVARRL